MPRNDVSLIGPGLAVTLARASVRVFGMYVCICSLGHWAIGSVSVLGAMVTLEAQ